MVSRSIKTDELTLQIQDAGEGPLVILLHGFPDLSIGWQHQIKALAEAGYHAVAPDLRGYGGTGGPQTASAYSIFSLVGDVVALVEALGETRAVVIGHDWGAALAWHCALLRPDMFHAVMALSVPFQPRRTKGPPTEVMRYLSQKRGEGLLYMAAFADPDAHVIMDADPEAALRKMFWSFDGATADEDRASGFIPDGQDFLSAIPDSATVPPWMSDDHFQRYVAAFRAGGFERPVHWYRKIDANWQRTRWLQGRKIAVPACFMVGSNDPVRQYAGQHEAELREWVPDLRGMTVVPGAGHWINQEQPEVVNAAILGFLWDLSLRR